MLLAFERQENASSACTTNSLHPHHPISGFVHAQVDQEPDQNGQSHGGLEELGHASALCIQPQEADAVPIPLGQQTQEKVGNEASVVKDGHTESEQAEPAEKTPHKGETEEASSSTQTLECSASSRIIYCEVDEEDEEPRPAKRRKRNSQLTRQTPVHVEQHVWQTSRSPSVTRESVPVAEYQEWPFEAFSNAQGSGMRQHITSSSNCRVCHSCLAYRSRHAMMSMCLQRIRCALRRLLPQSLHQRRDPGQGLSGCQKTIQSWSI